MGPPTYHWGHPRTTELRGSGAPSRSNVKLLPRLFVASGTPTGYTVLLVFLLELRRFCPRGEAKPPVLTLHGTSVCTGLSWFLSQTHRPQDGTPALHPWGRRLSQWPDDPNQHWCLQAPSDSESCFSGNAPPSPAFQPPVSGL